MDYLSHNQEEHKKAKDMAKAIKKETNQQKKEGLFKDLYTMIYSHHHAEEEVVFSAVMKELKTKEDKDTIFEMKEEHSLASFQFSVANQTALDNESWDAKFSALMEVLEHHMEEEEKDFAKLAKEVLSKEKRQELLEEFERAYDKYEKEIKEKLK